MGWTGFASGCTGIPSERTGSPLRPGEPDVHPDPPPGPPHAFVARSGRRNGRVHQARRHPRPGQVDLLQGQRLPPGPVQRRRHPVGRPDQPPYQPPQFRPRPLTPLIPCPGTREPRRPRFGPPEGERSRARNRVLPVVHTPSVIADALTVSDPDQGGEQGEQAEAVEGGVVAGHGQAVAARPDDDP
jgi:hypothetical protein